MEYEELMERIGSIRKHVFANQIEDAINKSAILLEDLLRLAGDSDLAGELEKLAEWCMMAIDNKDYLLLADLVYFEIPHILNVN